MHLPSSTHFILQYPCLLCYPSPRRPPLSLRRQESEKGARGVTGARLPANLATGAGDVTDPTEAN